MGVPAKNYPRVAYVLQAVIFMLISVVLLYTLRAAAEEWDWYQYVDSENFDAANH
jgi:membrane protein implicated in regulation of membrane protease activity